MQGGKGADVPWATPGVDGADGDPLEYLKGRGLGAEGSEELIVCHCPGPLGAFERRTAFSRRW